MAGRALKTGAAIWAATSQQSDPTDVAPTCPTTTESLVRYHYKYHADDVCDRVAYDAFKRNLGKHLKYAKFKETGEHNLVPNQKTLVCPAVVNDLNNYDAPLGYDTNWFVENTASAPVVLAYIDPQDGREKSALDSSISPPEKDPRAILKPGEWKHVNTYEGHVFHARELTDDGSPGRVLLQHRAGLIPVGNKARKWITCPIDDPEPMIEEPNKPGVLVRDPKYARTLERPVKECNLMDLGFRNMAGCPLDAYWQRPDTCEEKFQYHLGTNGYTQDFHWDWNSPTKFESTKIGHTFVFRNPVDHALVDQVTILPTQIVDCPNLKQKVNMPVTEPEAIMLPTGEVILDDEHQDVLDGVARLGNNGGNDTRMNATNNTTASTATSPIRPSISTNTAYDSFVFASFADATASTGGGAGAGGSAGAGAGAGAGGGSASM